MLVFPLSLLKALRAGKGAFVITADIDLVVRVRRENKNYLFKLTLRSMSTQVISPPFPARRAFSRERGKTSISELGGWGASDALTPAP